MKLETDEGRNGLISQIPGTDCKGRRKAITGSVQAGENEDGPGETVKLLKSRSHFSRPLKAFIYIH